CPLYPYIHIAAIIVYGALIIDMGKVPLLICAGFVAFSGAWYFIYVRRNVSRQSALMHIVTRATARDLKTPTLENELRDILIERDDIIEDRFDKLVKRCEILDIEGTKSADEVFRQVSAILAKRLATDQQGLFEKFLQREAESGTVIEPGLAIPHIVVEGQNKFDILLVRAQDGVRWPQQQQPVKIMFVLVGSKDERNYHLRALMAIAQIAQEKHFHQQWLTAKGVEGIRNLVLLSTRKRDTNI
ncbi:MAG TPA: PTS sugar transporter subunit IIA, partial [Sedimentisphaerales bacterium]|nr:PTS sugar transporter subunit IIA [Sedimentisphaerales bacterium]